MKDKDGIVLPDGFEILPEELRYSPDNFDLGGVNEPESSRAPVTFSKDAAQVTHPEIRVMNTGSLRKQG